MENKVLQKNLEVISKYDKNLSDKILMFDIQKSNIGLIETEQKEYNIVFNNVPLHSQFGAIKEAKNIVSNIEDKQEKNCIRLVYGLGLGYLIDEMAAEINDALIIVYEPNIELLKFVFSIAEIDAIARKNVIICSDKKMLKQHIADGVTIDSKLTISFLTSYKNLFLDDIKDVLKVAQNTLGENDGNLKTFKKKALLACRNSFWAAGAIFSSPTIFDLADIYKGKTAICLSAGPSLKENIEIIKNNQDKFVIFAVNPTVKLLAQQGITPDFIVDIEPIDNMSHFSGIDMSKQVLILEGFACNYLWRMKTKKKISYLSNDNFFNYFLRDCMKIEGHLETFGTVSYTALMSAFIMGFKKIILCGQDLAYKNGECYAKGSQYGEVECIYNNEVKKYEIRPKDENKYIKAFESEKVSGDVARRFAMNYIKFLNKNICTVKSQNGEDIPTQTGYALFIKQFSEAAEKLKVKRPEIELINSSIGGAQIDGFENKNLSDVILELESMDKIDVSTYKSHIDKNHIAEKLEKLIEQMKIFQKLSQDIELVCEKIIREIKNKKILTKDLEKLFNKYKEIYTNIMELSKKKDVSFVITAFMCRFIELLQIDYTKSPIELLQNFEKIKKYSEKNNVLLARDIAGLCNRKALILK